MHGTTVNGEFVTHTDTWLIEISARYLGNSFSFNDLGSLEDGYVLFAGKPGVTNESLSLTVRAVDTFNDNTTQEETLEIYLPLPELPESMEIPG